MLAEIEILGFGLKTFGLFFALNFIAWSAVAARRLEEIGRPREWASEMLVVSLAGGLLGAKLYFLAQHPEDFSLNGIIAGAGLTWYGGLLGGAIAIVAWARWRGFLNAQLLDLCGPCLAIGYAIGRIGCQISGDGDYGVPSDAPWAMAYPDGVVPTQLEVHPTPIYETLMMGLLAFLLWKLRDRFRPGVLFALYLIGAGLERFVVEFVRRNPDVVAGLSDAQLTGAVLAAGGVAMLVWLRRRWPTLSAPPAPA